MTQFSKDATAEKNAAKNDIAGDEITQGQHGRERQVQLRHVRRTTWQRTTFQKDDIAEDDMAEDYKAEGRHSIKTIW